jgi:hypothetical protein
VAKKKHIPLETLRAEWPRVAAPTEPGIYIIRSRAPTDVAVKIGWTARDIRKRIRELQTAHPWPLEVLWYVKGASADDERDLHQRFDRFRLAGSTSTEWFAPAEDLLRAVWHLRSNGLDAPAAVGKVLAGHRAQTLTGAGDDAMCLAALEGLAPDLSALLT